MNFDHTLSENNFFTVTNITINICSSYTSIGEIIYNESLKILFSSFNDAVLKYICTCVHLAQILRWDEKNHNWMRKRWKILEYPLLRHRRRSKIQLSRDFLCGIYASVDFIVQLPINRMSSCTTHIVFVWKNININWEVKSIFALDCYLSFFNLKTKLMLNLEYVIFVNTSVSKKAT